MAGKTRLEIAKRDIFKTLNECSTKVFTKRSLDNILEKNRDFWRLSQSLSGQAFIDFLSTRGQLTKEIFTSEEYGTKARYCWSDVSDYQLALSLFPEAYLSHFTAVYLHGLTDQIPQVIYINKEQSPKPKPHSELNQSAIDRAFANRPRTSKYIFSFRKNQLCCLSGKSTKKLEVGELATEDQQLLRVTKIERTLIDIAVRPEYAGGVYEILSAYRAAKGRISSNVLLATLKQLDYVYPYHQAIGFYMSRAGYPQNTVQLFREFGFQYDFYLTHKMPEMDYDPEWHLHIPKGF
jgi:predicted transcriptional regulator of viral defense system